MRRLKNVGLIFCLFIVLLVIFSSYFRASAVGTLFGALAGTPLLVHVFNRLAPDRQIAEPESAIRPFLARPEPLHPPTEQIVVLRVEGPNGRP
ncbi:MAG: hypothetical protein LC130_25555 [Bryobacterales bacterium]|nr:hypothetical protein [Bryobacterales bacterium]